MVHLLEMAAAAPTLLLLRFKRIEAWHRRTRAQLEGIVRWLEGCDMAGWEAQTEIAEQCVADIAKMARPLPTPKRKGLTASPAYSPVAAEMLAAKPHARAMLDAMRERRRAAALESGKTALVVLQRSSSE
jgi:hypothetical protein